MKLQEFFRKVFSVLKREIIGIIPKPNDKIRNSNWYHNMFPHLDEYERIKQGADIICLGSTPAKFAIDFKALKTIEGYNLAVLPETIHYDFQVLKNYHSFLHTGGTVLFVLCPFTFLKDKYRPEDKNDIYKDIRYYPILHRAMIDNFDINIYHKWVEKPFKIGWQAIKSLIYDSRKSRMLLDDKNHFSDSEIATNAKDRFMAWMTEFDLGELSFNNLSEHLQKSIRENIQTYKDMKKFIEERGYKAMIVIPPFSADLTELIPQDFINDCLIKAINEIKIPYLNYWGKEEWMLRDLYLDSYRLNATGREMFTKEIIDRIL